LCDDKLDGNVSKEFFSKKQAEYKQMQQDINQKIQEHEQLYRVELFL